MDVCPMSRLGFVAPAELLAFLVQQGMIYPCGSPRTLALIYMHFPVKAFVGFIYSVCYKLFRL